MVRRSLLVVFIGITFTCTAIENIESKQNALIKQLIENLVQKNISVQESVSSLLQRYPEKVDSVITIALQLYPKQYRQILIGTIQAEPALTAPAVANIISHDRTLCAEVIKIAITTEPAYVNEIILAAVQSSKDPIQDIVRVAVTTEPLISNTVLENIKNNQNENLIDILVGVIKAVPERVTSVVDYALSLFPDSGEDIVAEAVKTSDKEFSRKIVEIAIEAGVDQNTAITAAINSGADKKYFLDLTSPSDKNTTVDAKSYIIE